MEQHAKAIHRKGYFSRIDYLLSVEFFGETMGMAWLFN